MVLLLPFFFGHHSFCLLSIVSMGLLLCLGRGLWKSCQSCVRKNVYIGSCLNMGKTCVYKKKDRNEIEHRRCFYCLGMCIV